MEIATVGVSSTFVATLFLALVQCSLALAVISGWVGQDFIESSFLCQSMGVWIWMKVSCSEGGQCAKVCLASHPRSPCVESAAVAANICETVCSTQDDKCVFQQ